MLSEAIGGKGLEAGPERKPHIPRQRHHVLGSRILAGGGGRIFGIPRNQRHPALGRGGLGRAEPLKCSSPVKMPVGAVGGEEERGTD